MLIPWRRLWSRKPPFDIEPGRWVVLDVESSGLDPRRDRLLSIAAVGLELAGPSESPQVKLGDCFEVVLRQEETSGPMAPSVRDNILLHGIGLGAQAGGLPPAEALRAFQTYVGRSPLVAYHSFFDKTLIDRHMHTWLGQRLGNPWIDLEHVAAVLHHQPRRSSLDHWLGRFNIECIARHHASADALATAELLLRLWPLLRERGVADWAGLERLAGEIAFMAGRQ